MAVFGRNVSMLRCCALSATWPFFKIPSQCVFHVSRGVAACFWSFYSSSLPQVKLHTLRIDFASTSYSDSFCTFWYDKFASTCFSDQLRELTECHVISILKVIHQACYGSHQNKRRTIRQINYNMVNKLSTAFLKIRNFLYIELPQMLSDVLVRARSKDQQELEH